MTIPIYVGYDPREAVAYHTFCQSVIERTRARVSFIPLTGHQHDGSNRFIYARFLPFVGTESGFVIFVDGDMTCLGDIEDLWALRDFGKAVQVVKHDYHTKFATKYWGQRNDDYPRKNWSSVMLMNLWHWEHFNARHRIRQAIAEGDGSFLHRFGWLRDDQIGALPPEWNWLAQEYPYNPDAKLVHHTIGLPLDPAGDGDPYRAQWLAEHAAANRYAP